MYEPEDTFGEVLYKLTVILCTNVSQGRFFSRYVRVSC